MNNNPSLEKEKNDFKGITFISIGILTIVVAIAGSTYAWFAVSISSDDNTATKNIMQGESGYTASPLSLTITHNTSSSVGTKKLIPQTDAAIQKAVTGASGKGACVDANGNAICKVYTITVKNNTTTQYYVDGTFTLTADSMPNLKWTKGTSDAVGFPTPSGTYNDKSTTTLVSDAVLAGGASVSYYVVVWISEKGGPQTDSGTFTGTVSFTGSNAAGTNTGITSTIT